MSMHPGRDLSAAPNVPPPRHFCRQASFLQHQQQHWEAWMVSSSGYGAWMGLCGGFRAPEEVGMWWREGLCPDG